MKRHKRTIPIVMLKHSKTPVTVDQEKHTVGLLDYFRSIGFKLEQNDNSFKLLQAPPPTPLPSEMPFRVAQNFTTAVLYDALMTATTGAELLSSTGLSPSEVCVLLQLLRQSEEAGNGYLQHEVTSVFPSYLLEKLEDKGLLTIHPKQPHKVIVSKERILGFVMSYMSYDRHALFSAIRQTAQQRILNLGASLDIRAVATSQTEDIVWLD